MIFLIHLRVTKLRYDEYLLVGVFPVDGGGRGRRGEGVRWEAPSALRPLVSQLPQAVAGRQRGRRQVAAQAEGGRQKRQAAQSRRLVAPPTLLLLLQQLVQVGAHAAAHSAPQLAVDSAGASTPTTIPLPLLLPPLGQRIRWSVTGAAVRGVVLQVA